MSEKIGVLLDPREFTLAGNIDSQKFYLEFKNRVIGIVSSETADLKSALLQSDNCHLILLKHTTLVDAIIQASLRTAIWYFNQSHGMNFAEKDVPIAIVARGGYGREEMYFRSDVDIQIVSKPQANEETRAYLPEILSYFEYLFIHQDIFSTASSFSHSEAGVEDREFDLKKPGLLISLMEHRFVAGEPWVYNEFKSSIKTASLIYAEPLLEYCKKQKNYYDIQDTVFTQEPDVKEEQRRVYWALFLARLRHKLESANQFEMIDELYRKGVLSETAFKTMQNSLNFLAKVRLVLHCNQRGAHRDVLSYEVREKVAEAMGCELNQFYKEYFYDAAYPLKRYSRNLFWEGMTLDSTRVKNLSHSFAVNGENQIIFINDGEAYLCEKPETILQILSCVAKDDYNLSHPVVRVIEDNVDQINPVFLDEERKNEILERFKAILKGGHFAKGLRLLHEFGLLQHYYIPEFKNLCGLLQDIYVHKYPTDVHILAALDQLENLDLGKNADRFLVDLYYSIKDKTVLKLATLLHDIGKGMKEPGQNEEIVGSKAVPRILERLGYSHQPKRIEDVAFLVEKHLTMRDLMLLDPEEDETYEMVWDLVDQNKERLKMLILLTYADRGGTKMKMSSSQIDQLKNFYQFTLDHKKRKKVTNAVKLEFLKMIRLPRELQAQLEIYNEFLHTHDKFAVEMLFKPSQPSELVICCNDRMGLLFNIATVLFFNQVSIVEANIHTEGDTVFDVFKVCTSSGTPIEFSNYFYLQKQIKEELRRIFVNREPVSSLYPGRTPSVQAQAIKYKEVKLKIKIIGRAVTIETHDVLGTFMMESKVFSDLKMEVQRAVIHSHHEIATNIFYLHPRDVAQIMNAEEHFKNKMIESLSLLRTPQPIFAQQFTPPAIKP